MLPWKCVHCGRLTFDLVFSVFRHWMDVQGGRAGHNRRPTRAAEPCQSHLTSLGPKTQGYFKHGSHYPSAGYILQISDCWSWPQAKHLKSVVVICLLLAFCMDFIHSRIKGNFKRGRKLSKMWRMVLMWCSLNPPFPIYVSASGKMGNWMKCTTILLAKRCAFNQICCMLCSK